MTQQTLHDRAIEAAVNAYRDTPVFKLQKAINVYLTTLLDSPEMRKTISTIMRDELASPYDIIAAIKKEAGL